MSLAAVLLAMLLLSACAAQAPAADASAPALCRLVDVVPLRPAVHRLLLYDTRTVHSRRSRPEPYAGSYRAQRLPLRPVALPFLYHNIMDN